MKNRTILTKALPFMILPFLFACGDAVTEETAATTATAAPAVGQSAVEDDMSAKNVVQIAVASPDHKTLVAAVQHVEYADVLSNAGPFTVYAPTDAAFAALPAGTLDNLLKPENKMILKDILEYHVALGVLKPENMVNGRSFGMANGDNVKYTVAEDGSVMINDAKVLGSVPAANGLVVVIDKVLLPPSQ